MISQDAGPETWSPGTQQTLTEPYPQIERLCADFGLRVTQTEPRSSAAGAPPRSYGLVDQYRDDKRHLTPWFASMSQLEAFVTANLVDILHNYFFDDPRLG